MKSLLLALLLVSGVAQAGLITIPDPIYCNTGPGAKCFIRFDAQTDSSGFSLYAHSSGGDFETFRSQENGAAMAAFFSTFGGMNVFDGYIQHGGSGARLDFGNPGSPLLQSGNGGFDTTTVYSATHQLNVPSPGTPGLVIQAIAGQTADLIDVRDPSGASLLKLDASGNLTVGSGLQIRAEGMSCFTRNDEGKQRVLRGGKGRASEVQTCLKDKLDTYVWTSH